jgi:hypothetical protein
VSRWILLREKAMMRERGGGAGDEDGANAPISLEEERGDDDSYLFLEERVRCFFPLCEKHF